MSSAKWEQNLNEADFKAAGFTLYTDTNNDPDFPVIATAEIDQLERVSLCFSPKDPEHLYVVLEHDPTWLHLPIKPSPENLKKVQTLYITPAMKAKSETSSHGVNALAQTVYLRSAEGRVNMAGKDIKTKSWFMGQGNYDDVMVDFENTFTMCEWLSFDIARQATANGDKYSQWFTQFSRSLVTIMREDLKTAGAFTLEVQYQPSFHSDFTKTQLAQYTKGTALENVVPSDIPLDVAGFLQMIQPVHFVAQETLLKSIKDGGHDYWDLTPLALVTPDAEFESVFTPLAMHDNQYIRDFTATEAIIRGDKTMFELAKKHGISERVREGAIKAGL